VLLWAQATGVLALYLAFAGIGLAGGRYLAGTDSNADMRSGQGAAVRVGANRSMR